MLMLAAHFLIQLTILSRINGRARRKIAAGFVRLQRSCWSPAHPNWDAARWGSFYGLLVFHRWTQLSECNGRPAYRLKRKLSFGFEPQRKFKLARKIKRSNAMFEHIASRFQRCVHCTQCSDLISCFWILLRLNWRVKLLIEWRARWHVWKNIPSCEILFPHYNFSEW